MESLGSPEDDRTYPKGRVTQVTESFLKIVNMSISADRVKSILTYRKPTFWVIVTALALFALVVVCLVTDPVQVTYTMGEAQPISKSDVQDEHVLCVWDVVHCSNIVTLSADFRHGEKYDWLKIQPMGLQLTDGEHVMKCKSMGITEEHQMLTFDFRFQPVENLGDHLTLTAEGFINTEDQTEILLSEPLTISWDVWNWGDARRFSYATDDLEITMDISSTALTAHVYQREMVYENLDAFASQLEILNGQGNMNFLQGSRFGSFSGHSFDMTILFPVPFDVNDIYAVVVGDLILGLENSTSLG